MGGKGSSGGGGTNTVVQNSQPPPQVMAAYQNVVNQSQNIGSQPLQQYTGPLVAGFTPDQTASMQEIQGAQGLATPYLNAATQYAGLGAAPIYQNIQQFSPDAVSQYQNPYNQQVVQATQNLFNQQNAQQQNQLVGNAAAAGALGGDRQAVAQAQLAGQQQLTEAPQLANILSQGYGQALGELNTQQQLQANVMGSDAYRASNAAYQLGGLGSQAQQEALSGASALQQSGSLQQAMAQQQLNIPYEMFLQQQAYPYQQTNFEAGIAEGVGGMMGGNSSTTSPSPSSLGSVAGAGLAGLGGFGLGGGFSGLGDTIAGWFGSGGPEELGLTLRRGGRILPKRQFGGEADVPDPALSFIPGGEDAGSRGGPPRAPVSGGSSSSSSGSGSSGGFGLSDLLKLAEAAAPYVAMALKRGGRTGFADGGTPGSGGGLDVGDDTSIGTWRLPANIPHIGAAVPALAQQGGGSHSTIPTPPPAFDPTKGQPSVGDLVSAAKFGKSIGDPDPDPDPDPEEEKRGGLVARHGFDDGGSVGMPSPQTLPGDPQAAASQRYMALPIDKLQQLSNTYPPNTQMGQTVRKVLNQKLMVPQATKTPTGNVAAPTAPAGPMGGVAAPSGLAPPQGYAGGGATTSSNPNVSFVNSPSGVALPQLDDTFMQHPSGGFTQGLGTGIGGLGNAFNPSPQLPLSSMSPPNVITNAGTPQAQTQTLPAFLAATPPAAAAPTPTPAVVSSPSRAPGLTPGQQQALDFGLPPGSTIGGDGFPIIPDSKRGGRTLPKRQDGGLGDPVGEEVADDAADQVLGADGLGQGVGGQGVGGQGVGGQGVGQARPNRSQQQILADDSNADSVRSYLNNPDYSPALVNKRLSELEAAKRPPAPTVIGGRGPQVTERNRERRPPRTLGTPVGGTPAGAPASAPAAGFDSPDVFGAERDLLGEARDESKSLVPVNLGGGRTGYKVDPFADPAALDYGAGYNPEGPDLPGAPPARPRESAVARDLGAPAAPPAAAAEAGRDNTIKFPARPTHARQEAKRVLDPQDKNRNLYMGMLAAGLGMMSSRSPFAMNAIGDGGLAGLKTYAGLEQQDRAGQFKQAEIDRQRERDDTLRQHYENIDNKPRTTYDAGHLQIVTTDGIMDFPDIKSETSRQHEETIRHNKAAEGAASGQLEVARIKAEQENSTYLGPSDDPENPGSVFLNRRTGETEVKPVKVAAKPSTKGQSPTEFKYNAWLAVHPGDRAGALDYVAGHKQLTPQEMAKGASQLAQRELGTNADPADLDARAKVIFANMQTAFGTATKPAAPAPPAASVAPKPGNSPYRTADDVKAAVQSKAISPERGVQILRDEFGYH